MELEGQIDVGKNLNPDASGRPSPLFVRVYQLKTAETLLGATYQDLFRNDAATLGADLLKREIFEFCPATEGAGAENDEKDQGKSRSGPLCHSRDLPIKISLEPDARYLGVVAAFYDIRDPTGRWRQVREIPQPKERFMRSDVPPKVRIKLERTTVSLSFE